jgi:3-oxoacyl-[acyl-carrier protein] reductase
MSAERKEEKMEFELRDKVAIVTGAGQGIGKEIALELARHGADVVLADIKMDTTAQAAKEIEGVGRRALFIRVDVSKPAEVEAMVKQVIETFGRVDILVNNAGISPKGKGGAPLKMLDIDEGLWDTVMNINLKSTFNCCKAVMPFMMSRRTGKIVNLGSVAGLTGGAGGPSAAPYAVSKAGVICLTKVLARELASYNINVNAIAPGRILTEMATTTSAEANEDSKKATPLGRFGKPIDVARVALFLVAESGDFMTGETVVIDGGRVMH